MVETLGANYKTLRLYNHIHINYKLHMNVKDRRGVIDKFMT